MAGDGPQIVAMLEVLTRPLFTDPASIVRLVKYGTAFRVLPKRPATLAVGCLEGSELAPIIDSDD